jgi:hypothetical protein
VAANEVERDQCAHRVTEDDDRQSRMAIGNVIVDSKDVGENQFRAVFDWPKRAQRCAGSVRLAVAAMVVCEDDKATFTK